MQDEIKAHLDSQFIGPTEACWKIFEFNMHEESPAIQYLPVNLPNEHYVKIVWALLTGSSLNTIPGMLKPSHGIQDNVLR